MLVMVLGFDARRVMQCGCGPSHLMLVAYDDARRGVVQFGFPFGLSVRYLPEPGDANHAAVDMPEVTDFFPRLIDAMLTFFDTRQAPFPVEQTLEVAAILEAGIAALDQPDVWVNVPR